ncbi:hypothetical protein [Pseudoduganella aquatica]|uniref:hypothetical protein n=1 Tax=Pseudoduganella aquatica TaxID=2660641 RepID=UPI001E36C0DC|nr:hypothetical protein [Pseudoduganella aquatica]
MRADNLISIYAAGYGAQINSNDAIVALTPNSYVTIIGSGNDIYAFDGANVVFAGNANYVEMANGVSVTGTGSDTSLSQKGQSVYANMNNVEMSAPPFHTYFSADGRSNSLGGLGVILDANMGKEYLSPTPIDPRLVIVNPPEEIMLVGTNKGVIQDIQ